MKTLPSCFVTCLVTLAALPRAGAVLDTEIVPADARWVIYADLNALRTSKLGNELVAIAEKAQIDTGHGKIGFDVPKVLATIGTITAYGTNFSSDPKEVDGTLVIQGTPDLRKIVEGVLLQATLTAPEVVAEVNDLPFTAYAIRPGEKKDGPAIEVVVAFPSDAVVLVSKSRPRLLMARDVLRGAAPSLEKTGRSPLKGLLASSADAYLFTASVIPSGEFFAEDEPQARILKLAQSGALALGERGTNTFAHARLVAPSDQAADKLMKILQGLTASLSLATTSDKEVAEFLDSAKVSRDERTVVLTLAYSSERLAEMVRRLQQKSKERTAAEHAAAREALMVSGRVIAKWQAEPSSAPAGGTTPPLAWRTIENVALKHGTIITLGRPADGRRDFSFDRIEIVPTDDGTPLTFEAGFMRTAGRGSLKQIQFPGVDGVYNLKIAYRNDPSGKASYAVSLLDPKPRPNANSGASAPKPPQPAGK